MTINKVQPLKNLLGFAQGYAQMNFVGGKTDAALVQDRLEFGVVAAQKGVQGNIKNKQKSAL